jgi:hypothetical protein
VVVADPEYRPVAIADIGVRVSSMPLAWCLVWGMNKMAGWPGMRHSAEVGRTPDSWIAVSGCLASCSGAKSGSAFRPYLADVSGCPRCAGKASGLAQRENRRTLKGHRFPYKRCVSGIPSTQAGSMGRVSLNRPVIQPDDLGARTKPRAPWRILSPENCRSHDIQQSRGGTETMFRYNQSTKYITVRFDGQGA